MLGVWLYSLRPPVNAAFSIAGIQDKRGARGRTEVSVDTVVQPSDRVAADGADHPVRAHADNVEFCSNFLPSEPAKRTKESGLTGYTPLASWFSLIS